ncbi:hypothetical protein [Variovorax gossypii]
MTVLFDLARSVVDAWEKGDLAGAVCALDGHLSELDANRESHEETIEAARRFYADGSDDSLEIDDKPFVTSAEKGAWVSAWVWVPIDTRTLGPYAALAEAESAALLQRKPYAYAWITRIGEAFAVVVADYREHEPEQVVSEYSEEGLAAKSPPQDAKGAS